jgi:phosphoribosylformimino-5-aminoimidazole carboxamide ribotide isomerase
VVRLSQGDFDREQIYAEDPAVVAAAFGRAGAGWVHVVDLDGARAGERRQTAAIRAVREALPWTTRLQVGGGIRSRIGIAETLAAGADRVVLGTAALEDPGLVRAGVEEHGGDRIAVAIDVRGGLAIGHGWVRGAAAGRSVEDAIETLVTAGVRTFIATAIDRDGLLGGPDLALLERLLGLTDAAVIASGGITTIDDLVAARAIGCSGAIVGRAIYDGRIDLTEALAAVRSNQSAASNPRG